MRPSLCSQTTLNRPYLGCLSAGFDLWTCRCPSDQAQTAQGWVSAAHAHGHPGVGYSGNQGPSQMVTGSSQGMHLVPGLDRGNRASAGDWYDPGEPDLKMQWVRWEPRKMPLRVWISPGLQLPSLPFQELKATRVVTVAQMCFQGNTPNPFASLTQVTGWNDEMGEAVAAGIEMWKPLEQEGLFSYDFTPNPREANILVFFNDNFAGATEPGGISTGGYTCAQAIPYAKNRRGTEGRQESAHSAGGHGTVPWRQQHFGKIEGRHRS